MPENVNTSALVVEGKPDEKEDDRPVMIKVDHVSMSFNMASEQLNSLKEYAVAIAKRKLFFEEFKALDDVSFEVRKGDVFGIMGTNGSGKSTMLKIIAGVLEPTKGTCQVNGNIAPLIELGAGFDMDLSARENIYLNGALLGYSKEFIDENFDAIVEFAEVEKFLDMPLKNYSSGMVARIAFAIATVIVPEILVVDEVLSVGDFMFQKKCEDRITELIEQHGVTVLIVSHSNDQIARLCNKAIWIEKGHERLQGDADMVCRVYGGLGGRTGSKKAEDRVFEALVRSDRKEGLESNVSVFSGENAANTVMKLVREAWNGGIGDSAVLAFEGTHVNAVVANSFAGAIDAPVLPCGDAGLSDSVDQLLYSSRPQTIYCFDCGGKATSLFNSLSELPWNPKIVLFQDSAIFDFSWHVYTAGKEKGFWGDKVAFVCFEDSMDSIAAMPLLYGDTIPLFVLGGSEPDWVDVSSSLEADGIGTVLQIGSSAVSRTLDLKTRFTAVPFDVEDDGEVSKELFSYSSRKLCCLTHDVCIAPLSSVWWSEMLCIGGFSTKKSAPLFLVDVSSLDSISECIALLAAECNACSKLYFIGGKGTLGPIERQLFAYAACSGGSK